MNSDHIQALFDRIAPVYDELNNGLSFGMHHIWKRMTVKWSGAKPGDTCLDLCCGSGDIAQLLAEKSGKTGQVYGVDFSSAQLEVARDRAERRCIKPSIQWIQSDVLSLPLLDNQFDAITMGYGLRNVVDILSSLKEIHRVLKPGSKAAILDMHRPDSDLVRTFQQWYLDEVVVPTAQRMGFTEEYAYIAPSLDKFPTGREQVELSEQAGFKTAIHYPIAGGTMGVLVITK
jgi:demethylphylloquinol methyltransferase